MPKFKYTIPQLKKFLKDEAISSKDRAKFKGMLKRKKKSNQAKDLDALWSKLVKVRAGYKCEYCYRTSDEITLNSHHIYTRESKSTRWDLDNGICLCVSHHNFDNKISAHKAPKEFHEWLDKTKGEEFMDALRLKSNQIFKGDLDEIEYNLNNYEKV